MESASPPSTGIAVNQSNTKAAKDYEADETGAGTQEEAVLFASYPNPFNPEVTITYMIREPSHVSLEVFDMLGRSVGKLVDKYQQAGRKIARFNGSEFPSGTYFVSLMVGGKTFIHRILLVK